MALFLEIFRFTDFDCSGHRVDHVLLSHKMTLSSRFLLYRLPFLLYAALILGVSSIPKVPAPPVSDKFIHSWEYAFFAFLLWRAIIANRRIHFSWKIPLSVLLGGAAFGAFDEFYQSFVPGRESSIKDWYADIAGISTMITFLLIFVRWEQR